MTAEAGEFVLDPTTAEALARLGDPGFRVADVVKLTGGGTQNVLVLCWLDGGHGHPGESPASPTSALADDMCRLVGR